MAYGEANASSLDLEEKTRSARSCIRRKQGKEEMKSRSREALNLNEETERDV